MVIIAGPEDVILGLQVMNGSSSVNEGDNVTVCVVIQGTTLLESFALLILGFAGDAETCQ